MSDFTADTPPSEAGNSRVKLMHLACVVFAKDSDALPTHAMPIFGQFQSTDDLALLISAKQQGRFDFGVFIRKVEGQKRYEAPNRETTLRLLKAALEGELTADVLTELGLDPNDLDAALMGGSEDEELLADEDESPSVLQEEEPEVELEELPPEAGGQVAVLDLVDEVAPEAESGVAVGAVTSEAQQRLLEETLVKVDQLGAAMNAMMLLLQNLGKGQEVLQRSVAEATLATQQLFNPDIEELNLPQLPDVPEEALVQIGFAFGDAAMEAAASDEEPNAVMDLTSVVDPVVTPPTRRRQTQPVEGGKLHRDTPYSAKDIEDLQPTANEMSNVLAIESLNGIAAELGLPGGKYKKPVAKAILRKLGLPLS